MPESAPSPSLLRRALAVAVGLFATWQLIYLPAANLIDLVPRRPHGPDLDPRHDIYQKQGRFTDVEALQKAAEWTGDGLDFWAELSGQEQGWSLFAQGMPPYSVIPAAEFRFADGSSDTVLSPFEPTDKRNPQLRAPLVNNRPFNFEAQFIYPVWTAHPEAVEKYPEYYANLPNLARVSQKLIRAWLAWRLKEYRSANPDRPTPTEVILKHRYIQTPKPGAAPEWTQPIQERPFARWKPAADTFEAYDAVNKRFVPVEAQP